MGAAWLLLVWLLTAKAESLRRAWLLPHCGQRWGWSAWEKGANVSKECSQLSQRYSYKGMGLALRIEK
jgi:hypothetical protein